ncbi:uncharacterized protein LOC131538365 isoform X2 [Onychostoma macrolepis]|uniref:uncharacterized protein LOC131538365 isoform X2 n=1 Tax=Onychostoma macrolepis TaxID=369639 RepID=UPI00272D0C03|nr:uncharacterized protein LOC131538365 isoform X2 [Onychostoma macrolepis]
MLSLPAQFSALCSEDQEDTEAFIMGTADQLLELIFCWIKEKERFADNLRKLAEELESLREKCNVGECVGSSLKVLGAATMIGAGVATFFTFGATAPLMASAYTYTGIGSAICQTTKLIEHLCSSSTMKKVKNIEEKSNEIAKEIQELFQKLKSEKKEVNPLAEPDELHHIMAEFLRAIARQSGLNVQIINDSMLNDMLIHALQEFPLDMISDMDSRGAVGGSSSARAGRRSEGHFENWTGIYRAVGGSSSAGAGPRSEGHFENWTGISNTKSTPQMRKLTSILCGGVLSVVLISIQHKGIHKGKANLSDTVLHLLRSTGFQTSMRIVGGLGVGGLVGGLGVQMMTRALPEMIDNWKEMIEGNHVTEASQSLRDTAYGIQETTRTLKEQIQKIKKMLQEIEQEKQKLQEIEQEQQKLKKIKKEKQKSQKTEKEQQKLKELEETEEEESSEDEDPPAVNVGLLNVHSIKNMKEKRLKIKNLITENNLDVFLLTETWLDNATADEALRETVPANFSFVQRSREGRGGGVAILFSQLLHSQIITFESTTTFECVATALRHDEWDEDVLFINVYRPPIQTKQQFCNFVDEFEMLLNEASTDYNSIVVAGDFNVHVEDTYDLKTIIFENVCMSDFDQHVPKPTHEKGGILDLVFRRNVEVSRVHVRDDGISDHSTIYFSIRPASKDAKP